MPIYWKEFEDGNSTDGNYIVIDFGRNDPSGSIMV